MLIIHAQQAIFTGKGDTVNKGLDQLKVQQLFFFFSEEYNAESVVESELRVS